MGLDPPADAKKQGRPKATPLRRDRRLNRKQCNLWAENGR